jgi:hypothetical protein
MSQPDDRVIELSKRDLSAVYLIVRHIRQEFQRVRRIPADRKTQIMLMRQPSFSFLWGRPNQGALNEFFEQHGWFDIKLIHANQTARIVITLRLAGLVYNPEVWEDRVCMGDESTLVPKKSMYTLCRELIENYGHDPLAWPDSLPYDVDRQCALWNEVTLNEEPAYKL